jgi:hypothetical protein
MTPCGTISVTCRTVGLIRATGVKWLGTFIGFGVCSRFRWASVVGIQDARHHVARLAQLPHPVPDETVVVPVARHVGRQMDGEPELGEPVDHPAFDGDFAPRQAQALQQVPRLLRAEPGKVLGDEVGGLPPGGPAPVRTEVLKRVEGLLPGALFE